MTTAELVATAAVGVSVGAVGFVIGYCFRRALEPGERVRAEILASALEDADRAIQGLIEERDEWTAERAAKLH